MRRMTVGSGGHLAGVALIVVTGGALVAQQGQNPAAPPRHPSPAEMSQATLDDMLIRFHFRPDRRRMRTSMASACTGMSSSRRTWLGNTGTRVIPSSGAASSARRPTPKACEWLMAKFKAAGMSDVRSQPLDLVPQWFPQSWEVTSTGGGKTITLDSAQPDYGTVGTPAGGTRSRGGVRRARERGRLRRQGRQGESRLRIHDAGRPERRRGAAGRRKGRGGGLRSQHAAGQRPVPGVSARTERPAFAVGHDDGHAARELIAAMPAGQSARVKVKLSVERVPNLKTALIWGTLPGATDETIYIMAHRDGWFDAAGDNASGVASMVGLAEHYGKIPQAQRRRTMIFIGLDGHHNSGRRLGGRQSVDHREPPEAVCQDRAGDQHRAPFDHSDPVAAALLQRQRDRLGQHLHAAAVVCRRSFAPGAPEDCRRSLQAVRCDDGLYPEPDAAGERHELVLPVPPGRRYR